jgi:hypothetical protein
MITVSLPLAVRMALFDAGLAFLVVFACCWTRYGVREFRTWRTLRLGRDRKPRVWGEQPLCEFTAGPSGHGLVWHDQVLVEVVAEFERDTGIGGVR